MTPEPDPEYADRVDELYDRNRLLGIELLDQHAARAAQQAHDQAVLRARAIEHYRLVDL